MESFAGFGAVRVFEKLVVLAHPGACSGWIFFLLHFSSEPGKAEPLGSGVNREASEAPG